MRQSPPGIVACFPQSAVGILQGFLPIHPAGHDWGHLDSGVGLSILVIARTNSSQYVLRGCSLTILQITPSSWRCHAEGNQAPPEHGEVWHCHLGSGSYPRNPAWQMALRCFPKYPSGVHSWGICREHTRLFDTTEKSSSCTEPPPA